MSAQGGAAAVPSGGAERAGSQPAGRAPLLLVAGAVLFNLVELGSERSFVPMLNDGSVHAQMVRAASAAFRGGHLPLTQWYPYLGLGSPQFLHYQALGAMVTGFIGLFTGASTAFSWSLYLLVACWPICVYLSARLFGLTRRQAAIAAACASFLFSDQNVLSIGYEQGSYLWIGFGLWSQLWGMWGLPVAWAASWRAIRDGRYVSLAVVATAATIGFHFMTGYMALIPMFIWFACADGPWRLRLRRTAVVLVASVCSAAWVIYPVVRLGKWTSVNEFLQHTGSADSYGARQALKWLFTGALFDAGRLPVVTLLVGAGLVASALAWRRAPLYRALIVVFVVSMLLFFGRPTFGPLIDLLPGSKDLFLRRFLVSVQLSGLFLAGIGASALAALVRERVVPRLKAPIDLPRGMRAALLGLVVVVALAPAWAQAGRYDHQDAIDRAYQVSADLSDGAAMSVVVTQLDQLPAGRVYAGLPSPNWGGSFTVGEVPVFKYLSNLDFDMVGYTLRTASLMTDPEEYFDENNAGDYHIFGIRYLVLPLGHPPALPATLVLTSGGYQLYEVATGAQRIGTTGYVQLGQTQGTLVADRTNIGARSQAYLESTLPADDIFKTVAFAGSPAAAQTLGPHAPPPANPGAVESESDRLDEGNVTATVTADQSAVAVLKVSFDPGWRATVDGVPTATYMVSPAMVAVTIGPGTHVITFSYHGFGGYPYLFGFAVLTLATVAVIDRRGTLRR